MIANVLRVFLVTSLLFSILAPVEGQDPKMPNLFPPADAAMGQPARNWWEDFRNAWAEFGNVASVTEMLVVLLLAAVLGWCMANHPRTFGKAATLEEAEQPKIFIMYCVVGAIIAQLVRTHPIMGVVIFGIGGLFRFRTDVGPAKDTGRLIFVTCIGLCCGLRLFMPAVLATLFGWLVIYWLEGRVAHRVVIKGLDPANLAKAAEAYHEVLVEHRLLIMSEKKNFVKGQVAFVFRAPGELHREQLEELFKDIPPKLQGSADWESS